MERLEQIRHSLTERLPLLEHSACPFGKEAAPRGKSNKPKQPLRSARLNSTTRVHVSRQTFEVRFWIFAQRPSRWTSPGEISTSPGKISTSPKKGWKLKSRSESR